MDESPAGKVDAVQSQACFLSWLCADEHMARIALYIMMHSATKK